MVHEHKERNRRGRPRRADPQMKIRLPKDLKTGLINFALKNGRSCNPEIVVRLNKSMEIHENEKN